MRIFMKVLLFRQTLISIHPHYFSNKCTKLTSLLLEMPKDNSHTIALKTQRLKGKNKSLKYTPSTVNIQVLGSGAKGAPRSLYIFTDHSRYLFNCGEGSQRLAHEHKMKLSKLEHIFITHSSWENIGGLPGVALTIQDVGVPEISLHGPEGVGQIFPATRRFVILKNMTVTTKKCQKYEHFEDHVIKVEYVPLESSRKRIPDSLQLDFSFSGITDKTESPDDEIDYYAHERTKKENKRKRSPSPSHSKAQKVEEVAMSYICRLQPRPGALCLEKCVERGVPAGPLLGRLKAGEDIVLNDGTVVYSKDVTLPDDPGPLFIVIEVPSEDFLPSLEKESEVFSKYQETAASQDDVAFAVFHFTPTKIMQHPIYLNFMKKFSMSTHHILLNDSTQCLGSAAVHKIQYKLNMLEGSIFPLLSDKSIPISNPEKQESVANGDNADMEIAPDLKQNFSIFHGKTLLKTCLRPNRSIDSTAVLSIDPKEFIDEVTRVEGFSNEFDLLKENLKLIETPLDEYPNCVFLGTGSCIPNKTRNTSAILLNISDDCSIIFDCGEGTWGQLYRFYGSDASAEVLAKLKAVYISHLHADHHIGLIGLIKARQSLGIDAPLYLLAPRQISTWFNLYHNYFEPILKNLQLIPNVNLLSNSEETEAIADLKQYLGLKLIETCRVIHCPNSFGIAITHKNDWKITYSGDTMPCENLIKIGMNSDLLIHEATMEDELEKEAKEKLHSTTSQAINSGILMNAKFTLLTHFSQRYAKLPRITKSFDSNIGIAFDNMKVRFGDLAKLPLLYPVLKYMFHEDCEELEERAFKRQMKLERTQKTSL